MNEIEFLFIGWCKGTSSTGVKNDKVWTAFRVGNSYYAGWGGRGKKLRFKKHKNSWALQEVQERKRKDYDEVDNFRLFSIFPYFKEDVDKYFAFDKLTNRVMPA